MITAQQISVEEWEKKYRPIPNKFDKNASWQDENGVGIMFETYGKELDFVKAQDWHNVWTYVDGDNGEPLISTGFAYVNRIGYFITEVPWEDKDLALTVKVDD